MLSKLSHTYRPLVFCVVSTLFALFLLVILFAVAPLAAEDSTVTAIKNQPIYVDKNAAGSNDGSSWTDAYTDLQLALSSAISGTEIWVATGVYTPGSLRTDSFVLTDGFKVYGGFAATETLLVERDWETNVTVLSGDIGGDDTTNASGVVEDTDDIVGDNGYHVVKSTNAGGTTILDGFTITAGSATENFGSNSVGAGMRNSGGSPILRNLIFSANQAGAGGAMYNNNDSSPQISNSEFRSNSATQSGGAIYNDQFSDTQISNSTFSNNSAASGGAIFNIGNITSITDSTFSGNNATDKGGALFNDLSCVTMTDSMFEGNSSFPNGLGGAIYNYQTCSTLERITFARNAAGEGGGIYYEEVIADRLINAHFYGQEVGFYGGAIYTKDSSPKIYSSLISNNSAQEGGGIYNQGDGTLELNNVTISGNIADFGSGGIQNFFSSMEINNSILWNNQGTDGVETGSITNQSSPTVTISSSLVQGSGGSDSWNSGVGIDGGNNLDVDPLFIDQRAYNGGFPSGGDYRLMPTSPALNAGSNSSSAYTDLDGNTRIVQDIIDMGAYELPYYMLDLTVSGANQGTINGATDPCSDSCNEALPSGTVITLTVTTAADYAFNGWSGDCSGLEACVLSIDEDKAVAASFIEVPESSFTLATAVDGSGFGTISRSPDGVVYSDGTTITLTANASAGSEFDGWSAPCAAVTAPICSFEISSNTTVTATFSDLPGLGFNSDPLNQPGDGATISDQEITFEWDAAIEDEGAAPVGAYILVITGTIPSSSAQGAVSPAAETISLRFRTRDISLTPVADYPAGEYVWTVWVEDTDDALTKAGVTQSFTRILNAIYLPIAPGD